MRLGARYERSLEMLQYAKELSPSTPVKSGLMLGLGEMPDEVLTVMQDLRSHSVDILTLGQYLRPSPKHLPIACATFRPRSSTAFATPESRWGLAMWKQVLWFVVRIMPMNRTQLPARNQSGVSLCRISFLRCHWQD